MSRLRHEISEQVKVLDLLLANEVHRARVMARDIWGRGIDYLYVVARGSSDNAARYAKYLFSTQNQLPVALAAPSLFTRYHCPPRLNRALVIGISQSGRSVEPVEIVGQARNQGACTLAITNTLDSPLARAADHVLFCHAGEESSLAASKTYTAELAALAVLSVAMAGVDDWMQHLSSIPRAVQATLEVEEQARRAAERYSHLESLVVIGRGYNLATAYEVALKLKELACVVAEPFSSADFRHGPMAMISEGFPVIVIAPRGRVYSDTYETLKEVQERGADLMVISDHRDALALAQAPLPLPVSVEEWLSPLVSILPGQFLAMHLATARGLDPDRPKGLSKVTVTR